MKKGDRDEQAFDRPHRVVIGGVKVLCHACGEYFITDTNRLENALCERCMEKALEVWRGYPITS